MKTPRLAFAVGLLLLGGCGAPSVVDAGAGGGGGAAGGSQSGGGIGGGEAGGGQGGGQSGGGQGGQGAQGGGGTLSDGGMDAGSITCSGDGDCPSGTACLSTFPGLPRLCLIPCTQQTECAGLNGFFCNPRLDGGVAGGFCVPGSPAHCLSCAVDSDCGSFAEVCAATASDPVRACHVDCSLGGAAACPADYGCTAAMVNGVSRMLCSPSGLACQEALGGFCDRLKTAQPCRLSSDAGSCTGERYCLSGTRFDLCSAPAPQCKPDCTTADHSGCTELPCAGATSSVENCGSCGNACPGLGQPNLNVTCQSPACSLSCQGEHYDVDNSATNGCEVTDVPAGNHLAATAVSLGTVGCGDGNGHTVMGSGRLPSDARAHASPAVPGFDLASGSAQDLFAIDASGGLTCVNDISITLAVTGSGSPACFQLIVSTNKGPYSCSTSTSGTCTVSQGSSSYSGGNLINLTVKKTCSAATRGNPSYTVDGHL